MMWPSAANLIPPRRALPGGRTRTRTRVRSLGAFRLMLLSAASMALPAMSCAPTSVVLLARSGPALTINRPALYPETIEYDREHDVLLVGSFREGAVYRVDDRGVASRLVDDPRLCSVLGIAVDRARGRLWAVSSDLGASLKPSAPGPKKLAAVGIYDLGTGKPINYVDLSSVSPGDHLLNGIALDAAGSAYVTDSFSPVIYKVNAQGEAAVFARDQRFVGRGINLNGVVVHPDGYLLVVKKSEGSLFKVPLANPSRLAAVSLATPLLGGDGLTLVDARTLIVIANQVPGAASNAAFSLWSHDGWVTASVRAVEPLGDVYPTTAVLRDGKLFVVSSKLNQLIQSAADQKASFREQATIQQIGRLTP